MIHGRSIRRSRSSLGFDGVRSEQSRCHRDGLSVVGALWVSPAWSERRRQPSGDFVDKMMGVWLLVFAVLYSR